MIQHRVAGLLPAVLFFSLAGTAHAEQWSVSTVINSRGALDSFSIPVINSNNQVAFAATFDNGSLGSVVYRATGANLLTLADTAGVYLSFPGNPSINDNGEVAFVADLDAGGSELVRTDGTTTTPIAGTATDNLESMADTPFMNAGGTVVFEATAAGAGADRDVILAGNGGVLATVVDETGPYASLGDTPAISDDGTVAFYAGLDAGGFGVFKIKGATVTTAASSADYTSLVNLGLNNYNDVLVRGVASSGTISLFQAVPAGTGFFLDTTGIFNQLIDGWVSDVGTIAFHATLDQGLDAIFSGGIFLYERAVAVGDALDGSNIAELRVGRQSINSSGRFVFWARLADGTEGIYLATPKSDSCCGGGGGSLDGVDLALLGLLGIARRRLRRR